MGRYTRLLQEAPGLGPRKTVRLEQKGAGFLDGCIARGDVVLEYYGMGGSFGQVVGILLAYLAVVYLVGYLALSNAARRASRPAAGVE